MQKPIKWAEKLFGAWLCVPASGWACSLYFKFQGRRSDFKDFFGGTDIFLCQLQSFMTFLCNPWEEKFAKIFAKK